MICSMTMSVTQFTHFPSSTRIKFHFIYHYYSFYKFIYFSACLSKRNMRKGKFYWEKRPYGLQEHKAKHTYSNAYEIVGRIAMLNQNHISQLELYPGTETASMSLKKQSPNEKRSCLLGELPHATNAGPYFNNC